MRMVGQRPLHAGQDAREWPQSPPLPLRSPLDVGRIGNHRCAQPAIGGIGIIGHDHQVHDLRPQALDHVSHHRLAAELAQRLGDAHAHAPALAARQDDADQRPAADRTGMIEAR